MLMEGLTVSFLASVGFPLALASLVFSHHVILYSLWPAYMSSPCHIELILSEKEESVKKEVSLFTVNAYSHISKNSLGNVN